MRSPSCSCSSTAFFVAAEFGLVKLRVTRVKAIAKVYGWRGRILQTVHGDLDAYLSACQLGITLASLGLGWIGEPTFAGLLQPALSAIGIDNDRVVHAVAFFFAFFIISYLHIVVGEQAPKSMAIRVPEIVSIWTAIPLYAFYWLMFPAIWVVNHSSKWILGKVGLDVGPHDAGYSSEELKMILRTSHSDEDFTTDEWRVLAQALDFRDLEVADLMRPFREAVTLSESRELRNESGSDRQTPLQPISLSRFERTRNRRHPSQRHLFRTSQNGPEPSLAATRAAGACRSP